MNIYPAMRAHMGRWDYYIVKMNMRELAESVKFAADIYEDKTLDQAIQRVLNTSRVKKDIVTYLARQEDRFFASIVIAAIEGNPQWLPVFITDDDRFTLFKNDERLNQTFGVLSFDGTQQYYALDGQHRLAAIKSLLDSDDPAAELAPDGFREEEMSVLVVVPTQADEPDEFLKRYRRLFGNLNRYAKPMDKATNIIMDEDDAFAIVTRRLITEHEFFQVTGRQRESFRVKTDKGKNLKTSDTFFTSIEALYDVNVDLLQSRQRQTAGWAPEGDTGVKWKEFAKFRPTDETLDALFTELSMYWDGILAELPELRNDPPLMRNHSVDPLDPDHDPEDESTDHLLFWPIGQQMLAGIVRDALDSHRHKDPANPTPESVRAALKGLADLQWELHRPPWRYFMLTSDTDGSWRMRQDERPKAVAIGKQIQEYLLGLYELEADGVEELRREWGSRLIPAQSEQEQVEMWEGLVAQRS